MICYYEAPKPGGLDFTGFMIAVVLPDNFREEALAELCGMLRVYAKEFPGINVATQVVPGSAGVFVLCRGPRDANPAFGDLVRSAVDTLSELITVGVAQGDGAHDRAKALRELSPDFPSLKYIEDLFAQSKKGTH